MIDTEVEPEAEKRQGAVKDEPALQNKSKRETKEGKLKQQIYEKIKADKHPELKKMVDILFERLKKESATMSTKSAANQIKQLKDNDFSDELLTFAEDRACYFNAREGNAESANLLKQKLYENLKVDKYPAIKKFIDETTAKMAEGYVIPKDELNILKDFHEGEFGDTALELWNSFLNFENNQKTQESDNEPRRLALSALKELNENQISEETARQRMGFILTGETSKAKLLEMHGSEELEKRLKEQRKNNNGIVKFHKDFFAKETSEKEYVGDISHAKKILEEAPSTTNFEIRYKDGHTEYFEVKKYNDIRRLAEYNDSSRTTGSIYQTRFKDILAEQLIGAVEIKVIFPKNPFEKNNNESDNKTTPDKNPEQSKKDDKPKANPAEPEPLPQAILTFPSGRRIFDTYKQNREFFKEEIYAEGQGRIPRWQVVEGNVLNNSRVFTTKSDDQKYYDYVKQQLEIINTFGVEKVEGDYKIETQRLKDDEGKDTYTLTIKGNFENGKVLEGLTRLAEKFGGNLKNSSSESVSFYFGRNEKSAKEFQKTTQFILIKPSEAEIEQIEKEFEEELSNEYRELQIKAQRGEKLSEEEKDQFIRQSERLIVNDELRDVLYKKFPEVKLFIDRVFEVEEKGIKPYLTEDSAREALVELLLLNKETSERNIYWYATYQLRSWWGGENLRRNAKDEDYKIYDKIGKLFKKYYNGEITDKAMYEKALEILHNLKEENLEPYSIETKRKIENLNEEEYTAVVKSNFKSERGKQTLKDLTNIAEKLGGELRTSSSKSADFYFGVNNIKALKDFQKAAKNLLNPKEKAAENQQGEKAQTSNDEIETSATEKENHIEDEDLKVETGINPFDKESINEEQQSRRYRKH